MNTGFKVVIPARYGSTRLPGKPLLDLAGRPMIAHVCDRAREAKADEIVVATDDHRIFAAVSDLGVTAVMTRSEHQSGTERIAEVAQQLGWSEADIIVNLQGDEPLIPSNYIRDAALALSNQSRAEIATLAAEINNSDEIFNPNAVKVVLNRDGYALYFSRAPIPWDRDQFNQPDIHLSAKMMYLRHIGLYAYTVGFLNRYISWETSSLEAIEVLEQLRILWQGEPILVIKVSGIPDAGIDTADDLERVENVLQSQQGL